MISVHLRVPRLENAAAIFLQLIAPLLLLLMEWSLNHTPVLQRALRSTTNVVRPLYQTPEWRQGVEEMEDGVLIQDSTAAC